MLIVLGPKKKKKSLIKRILIDRIIIQHVEIKSDWQTYYLIKILI